MRRGEETESDEQHDAYRAVVDGLRHGVLILQGPRVAFANPAIAEATGYSREELYALAPLQVFERVHPDDRARAEERMAARSGDGAEPDPRGEFRLRCKDGTWRWFETHARRITFRGEPATAVSLVDATERKRIEQELVANHARLRLLIEARNEFTLEVDPKGLVVHASSGMVEAVGIPLERMIGMTIADLMAAAVHPDDVGDGAQNVAHLMTGGNLDEALHRVRRADGEYRWLESWGRTLETDQGRHIVILSRDVTERLAAQEERAALVERLHQTQKLEGLGLLAGGIAHDFNNLMVAVRTNAELASRAVDAASPARGFVDDICLAAEHARDLTRKLLAYAGRTSTAVATVDVSEIGAAIAHLFRGTLPEAVQLSVAADAEPAFVVGDHAQLGQLVLNLLRNAGEAIAGGGTIALRTGVRSLTERDLAGCVYAEGGRPGRYAYVSVVDTGCGIAPECVGRVFDPFFTTKAGGTGLGLASVLGTVRSHHGALRLVTRVGAGTRIEIFLPSVEAGAERGRSAATPPARTSLRGPILVVDDQAPVRRGAAQLLQSRGYETVEAGGGREALEIARAAPDAFGAVLLDVTMPDFGGNRVFAELRRLRADLPVVFMSGHSAEDVAALTKGRTRVATIAKPFSGDEVEAALRRVTEEPEEPS
jgi:PAS domain S-box-containing protein